MTSGAPPASPTRQVVVVRQGPPKRRGAFIDGVVGVLGVALLVLAGVLGETLPEKEVISEQFLPEFPTTNVVAQLLSEGGSIPSEALLYNMLEGQEERISVLIPDPNVVSISMQVFLPGDDIGSSLPDSFTFKLYDPDGTQQGETFIANTAQPKQRANTVPGPPIGPGSVDNATKPIFVSGETNPATSWRLGAPPEAAFIGAEDGRKIDYAMALSKAEDEYTKLNNGTWTLVVTLKATGDCPAASTSGQQDRYFECQRETGNTGQDPGNPITIKFVRYDYYTITLPNPQAETQDAI